MSEPVYRVEAIRELLDRTPKDVELSFNRHVVEELISRIERYEKNLPSWAHGTPEDVDAWLRDLIPDDKRLAFYQWIGEQAVCEMNAHLTQWDEGHDQAEMSQRDGNDGIASVMWEIEHSGPYPSELPLGRPFCDVQWHTHPHGGGRLPTCRLDSPE